MKTPIFSVTVGTNWSQRFSVWRVLVTALLALAIPARAQTFPMEFWPAVPDRTRQVEHFYSCQTGATLVYKVALLRAEVAVVGAFIFIGRPGPMKGLYTITRVVGMPAPDGMLRDVTLTAICRMGLT